MQTDQTHPTPISESGRVVVNAVGTRFTVGELRGRVSIIEPGIVVMREIDMGTRETIDIFVEAIEKLSHGFDAYGIVVDLVDSTGGTTSDFRKYVPERFGRLYAESNGRLKEVAVVYHGNPVVRIVLKFFAARMSQVPLAVYKSRTQAVEAVRAVVTGH